MALLWLRVSAVGVVTEHTHVRYLHGIPEQCFTARRTKRTCVDGHGRGNRMISVDQVARLLGSSWGLCLLEVNQIVAGFNKYDGEEAGGEMEQLGEGRGEWNSCGILVSVNHRERTCTTRSLIQLGWMPFADRQVEELLEVCASVRGHRVGPSSLSRPPRTAASNLWPPSIRRIQSPSNRRAAAQAAMHRWGENHGKRS